MFASGLDLRPFDRARMEPTRIAVESSPPRRRLALVSHERPEGNHTVTARAKRASKARRNLLVMSSNCSPASEDSASVSKASPPSGAARRRDPGPWRVTWSNQWEPGTKIQHAFDCYAERFPEGIHCNEDIAEVEPRRDPRARAPRRRLPVPGLLRRQAAQPGARHPGPQGRPLVGDPPHPRGQAPAVRDARERRSPAQVARQPARARLRHHPRDHVRPRIPGRVARHQRRRVRLPPAPTPRLHHRSQNR